MQIGCVVHFVVFKAQKKITNVYERMYAGVNGMQYI